MIETLDNQNENFENQNRKSKFRKNVILTLRIFLSVMFLFSAYSKLYPSPALGLGTFEGKQLIPMGFSPQWAAIFSRAIVGGEFALGLALLMPYYFRKVIIPACIALLVVFTAHLTFQLITNGNESNCGCFGSLMPFSTTESIAKNVVFIGLFIWLLKLTKGFEDKKVLWIPFAEVIGCIAIVSLISMSKPASSTPMIVEVEEPVKTDQDVKATNETQDPDAISEDPTDKITKKDSVVKVVVDEPKQAKSGFKAQYADIDKGRKILCFFAPGCDHCKAAIRDLTAMKKADPNFPELKIIFMNEEADLIPEFFEQAGMKYTYKILEIPEFYTVMGAKNDTPNIYYIWNGNIIKMYSGSEESGTTYFKAKEFKSIVQKKYSELK